MAYRVIKENDKLIVKTVFLDLHRKEIADEMSDLELKEKHLINSYSDSFWSRYSPKLIPNAATIGRTEAVSGVGVGDAGYELESEKNKKMFLDYISLVGLTSISHPRGFEHWDIDLVAAPLFQARYQSKTLKLVDEKDPGLNPDRINYNIDLVTVLIPVQIGFDLHTPFGKIGAYGLYGPIYTNLKDSLGNDIHKTTMESGYRFEYTAFFTDRAFFYVSYQGFLAKTPVKTQFYHAVGEVSASMGVGYFLPEMRRIL